MACQPPLAHLIMDQLILVHILKIHFKNHSSNSISVFQLTDFREVSHQNSAHFSSFPHLSFSRSSLQSPARTTQVPLPAVPVVLHLVDDYYVQVRLLAFCLQIFAVYVVMSQQKKCFGVTKCYSVDIFGENLGYYYYYY